MSRLLATKLLAATALTCTLAACVPDTGLGVNMAATPPVQPAIVTDDPTHYAAVPDENFTVPAVPVEQVPPQFLRQTVDYQTDQPVGTIIIAPGAKFLYLVTGQR